MNFQRFGGASHFSGQRVAFFRATWSIFQGDRKGRPYHTRCGLVMPGIAQRYITNDIRSRPTRIVPV